MGGRGCYRLKTVVCFHMLWRIEIYIKGINKYIPSKNKKTRYLKIFLNMSFFYELILLEIMFRIQRMHKTVPFILAFLFILNMMIIKYEDNNNKNLVRFVCILIILRIF